MSKKRTNLNQRTVKALEKIAQGRVDPKEKLNGREYAQWLLHQPATQQNGNPIVMNGRTLTNMDVAITSMLYGKDADTASKMTVMTLAGVLETNTEDTEEEKKKRNAARQKHKRAIARYKRNVTNRLKKSNLYDPALITLIDSCALIHVSVEELHDEMAGEPLEYTTSSREGAKRVITRTAVSRLAEMQARMVKADRDLVTTAIMLKRHIMFEEENTDGSSNNSGIETAILKILNER